MNVIEANSCWDAYLKTLKALLDSKHLDLRNLFLQVNNTDDNYIASLPHAPDNLPWFLRVNSDVVEGELGLGAGLDVRYDQKRLGRVKGHGSYDWGYRDETGRPTQALLNLIMEDDEIFPNVGRVGGNGQLHYVKDLLMKDPTSDKGVVSFWNWKRDLLEYTKRKYLSPEIAGEEGWSDAQHQRVPCPVSWHFTVSKEGVNNNVYSRSMVWDDHIHDDMFRFIEPCKWIGGHLRRKSGIFTLTTNRLWVKNFEGDVRERLTDLYDFWSGQPPISSYYDPIDFPLYEKVEDFERDWQLKELAEQDYRLGAFEEGDKKLDLISSEYYKNWVRVIKVAEMTISHHHLGRMFRRGIHSRGTKRAMEYIDEYTLIQAVNDVQGIYRVQTVQWIVNYYLRAKLDSDEYKTFLELLPEELRELTLLSSLHRVKEAITEDVIKDIRPEYLKLSEDFRSNVVQTKLPPTRTIGEDEMRNPINTDVKSKLLVVDPYAGERVNRKYPAYIAELKKRGELDICYFPVEPFHRRENKRHATQHAMEACVKSFVPISLETRQEIPAWAIDALSRDKRSEARIQIASMDEKKQKVLYPSMASPEELFNSVVRCFNSGIYVVVKTAPIIPPIMTPHDVFRVVDAVRSVASSVEICFASFDESEYPDLKARVKKSDVAFDDMYELAEGRYFVRQSYRKEFIRKLMLFTQGQKLKLEVVKECSIEDGEVTGVLRFEE